MSNFENEAVILKQLSRITMTKQDIVPKLCIYLCLLLESQHKFTLKLIHYSCTLLRLFIDRKKDQAYVLEAGLYRNIIVCAHALCPKLKSVQVKYNHIIVGTTTPLHLQSIRLTT